MSLWRARVAIIHPWFPQYRRTLFVRLIERCAELGIDLRVFYGDPPPEWKERRGVADIDGVARLPTSFVRVGARSIGSKALRGFREAGPFDLVILEQAVRNLETYRLLLSPTYARRLAWWGHGRTYTEDVGPAQEKVKQWLTRRGRWFFAYTEGGKRAVANAGFPESRISVLNNTIDTTELARDLATITADELRAFRGAYRLTDRTVLFLGGIDAPKRIPFLLDAFARVSTEDPEARLLVVGAGSLQGLVERAAYESRTIRFVGPRFGRDKAIALAASQVLAIPGRVGLVAIDSFVSGVPIVTTRSPWHPPEFEYLVPGENAVVTDDDLPSYATGLRTALVPESRERLSAGAQASGADLTVEHMVEHFVDGIGRALAVGGR